MSEIRLDTHARRAVCQEIEAINHEFLHLLMRQEAADNRPVLGLDAHVIAGIRSLSDADLSTVASAPVLLAELNPLPGCQEVRDDGEQVLDSLASTSPFLLEQQCFANRLLTFVWQTARRDPLMTALCVGVDAARAAALARLNFAELSAFARGSTGYLQVRLAEHPSFWPDLLRLARNGNVCQQVASRFSALQLAVAGAPGSRPDLLAGR